MGCALTVMGMSRLHLTYYDCLGKQTKKKKCSFILKVPGMTKSSTRRMSVEPETTRHGAEKENSDLHDLIREHECRLRMVSKVWVDMTSQINDFIYFFLAKQECWICNSSPSVSQSEIISNPPDEWLAHTPLIIYICLTSYLFYKEGVSTTCLTFSA